MECNRSMCLRKVCGQCNTVVHVKRSVCDCGHAFASKKRKARCTAVGEPENAMKRRKALLPEEGLLVGKESDKVRKTSKRASETREQTLHRQEQNRTHLASMTASIVHETVINSSQHTSTITCTAAPRVWHFSAFHCIRQPMAALLSLVPRPSPAPVFDRLQYAKMEGEGLVNLTT